MLATPEFQLWLRRTLGQIAVVESQIRDVEIPSSELKVEIRRMGRWVTVDSDQLLAD